MNPKEKREHWMQIYQGIRNGRQGGSIDQAHLARLAESLMPHCPSFDYTLKLISQKMRGQSDIGDQFA